MAARFWVGGSGTWDSTTTTHWSATSGGAGGASVPTSADDVTIDSLSGTPTVTTNYNASVNSVTINATGATLALGGTLTSANAITLTIGTFTTNNFAVTAASLSSNNSNTRAINLGSSTVTLTSSGAVWQTNTITGLTFNAGTSTIVLSNSSVAVTLSGGGLTFYNVSFTGASTAGYTIAGTNTYNNLSFVGPSIIGSNTVTFSSNQTINGTLSTSGTAGNQRVFFSSATYGVGYTLTVNSAPSLTDADFRDIYVIGTAAPISGTRIGNRGNCSGITFSTPKTVYWNLAGAQNWSANGWAATSGGTPSTDYFPLPQDTATFTNAGSVTGTITLDAAMAYTGSVDMSARTSAMTLSLGTTATTCYGNWINGSGTTLAGAGNVDFTVSGEGIKSITSAGKAMPWQYKSDCYGGGLVLNDAFTCSNGSFEIKRGSFDTQGYAATWGNFEIWNTSGVKFVYFRNSTITCTGGYPMGSGTGGLTTSDLTFDAGTSTYNCTSGTITAFYSSGKSFYNLSFTGAGTLTNGFTCNNNLTFNAPAASGVNQFLLGGNITVGGTLTCSGASPIRRVSLRSNTIGTQRDLTVNAWSASPADIDFRDIEILGAAAPLSGTRFGDCGGNAGITFPSPKTVYWNLSGSVLWASTGWATSSGGTPAVNNFPLAQDTAVFDDSGAITQMAVAVAWNIGTVDMSARTSAMTFNTNSTSASFYGNWKNGSGTTMSGNQAIIFSGRGTQTITSAGRNFTQSITVDNFSGTVQLADALTISTATNTLTLTSGTFDAVTYNVTTGLFSAPSATTGSYLKMGTGTWTLSGTGSVWNNLGIAVLTKGTANIVLSDTSTTARTFAGGGLSYNKLTIGGTTGISTTTITSNNQFTELASTKTVAHTIALGTTTQTFGAWTVTGSAGNVVTLSGTGTIQLVGSSTSGIDYLAVGTTTVATGAAGPGQFFAGANSTGTGTGFIFTATPSPRTLYWVGGTGNWSSTARWSLSSGGAGGQAVPTTLDDVIFDSASNATAYTVTIDAASKCNQLTISGPASGNVTLAGSLALICHGNVTLPATGLTRTWTGTLVLSGSTTGKTFTTNGVTIGGSITVNGVGCGWSLGSSFSDGGSGITITVTNGSFNTSGYTVTAGAFSSSNTNTRSLILGSSTITVQGLNAFASSVNLTFDAGTSNISCTNSAVTFNGGGQTFYNLSFTSTTIGTQSILGANTFNNLTVAGKTSAGVAEIALSANQTINGTLTLSAGTIATMRTFVRSDTIGTTRTLTCNAVASLTDIDFRDIVIAGNAVSGGNLTGTRLGDCKGNTGITFDAPKTVYCAVTSSASWATTGNGIWSASSGGALSQINFPLAQDTAVFDNAKLTTGQTITVNANYNIGTIDMSARTSNTMTLSTSTTTPTIYGNWINGTGTTLSGNGTLTFAGRGNQTITSAGIPFTCNMTINTPGGSVTLQDALSNNYSGGIILTHTAGTINSAGYSVTFSGGGFSSSSSITRTIAFGSGSSTWSFAGTTPWNITSTTNLTITGSGTISCTSASAKPFTGGGLNYSGITLNQGGAGTLTISGNNTFANITNTYGSTGATTIALGATTQRVANFTAAGTAGNVLTITGNTSNLIYTGGGVISGLDYLNVQGRVYGPTGQTSNIWYAGNNSVNSGSLGWSFTSGAVVLTASITEAYTSASAQDTAANIFNATRTENSNLADSQVPTGVYGVTITENSNLADSESTSFTLYVSVTEPTTLADFQEFVNLIAVSITEGSIAGDSQSGIRTLTATQTNNLTSAATQSAISSLYAALVENSTSGSSQTVQAVFAGSISDGLTIQALTNATGSFTIGVLEALNVGSLEQGSNSTSAAITEGFEITEGKILIPWENNSGTLIPWVNNSSQVVQWFAYGVYASLVTNATRTDGVTSDDISTRQAIFSALISEALDTASAQSARADFNSLIAENMLVSDLMVGYGWFRIVDDQTATWTSIDNTQSITWVNVGDDQTPNWVEINNNQP